MPKITKIHAREILDSRGNPTIEVEVSTNKNTASAIVPSGASTGSYEAFELRDNDKRRYGGKGVLNAVNNVNTVLFRKLRGLPVDAQEKIDAIMIETDGTENKSNIGANAILGVSLACLKASALEAGTALWRYLNPRANLLPVPMMNVINGGKHADSGLDFQEFMIVPKGASTFREALRMGSEIFHSLKDLLKDAGHIVSVGDEGGFAPKLKSHEEAFDFLVKACNKTRYAPGEQVFFAIDAASSEFFKNGMYHLKIDGSKKTVSAAELVSYYESLIKKYPIISIEDGCGEDDFEGWHILTQRLKKMQIIGDDLFTTNPKRFERGIKSHIANAILIKPNQIGTFTETAKVIKMAKKAEYKTIISHRSGDTEDPIIADIAVGFELGQIKTGSLCRSERIAKYNQLLRIEDMLGRKAGFLSD